MRAAGRLTSVRWWPAVLIAIVVHTAPILYLLLPSAPAAVSLPDGPPLALTLAAPATVETPPSDAAVATRPSHDATPQQSLPDHPPEVAEGPKGTISAAKPEDSAPATQPAAVSSVAAAAPSSIPATPATEVAAPVEGAASQLQSAVASWESQVAARLEKAKRFPLTARMTGEEDTVIVSFSVDAQGRTSHARIRRSAGYVDLESEAQSLIGRVSPLPPPPDHGARQLSVPIEFHVDR